MAPIFKCLICRKDIERSKKSFWDKKGHLLCSTCKDNIDIKEKRPQLDNKDLSYIWCVIKKVKL